MRDAFGGTFMFQVFLVFILIYICFTAMALNYAKAFKVKDAIITYLEENQIVNLNYMTASEMGNLDNFFNKEIVGKKGYTIDNFSICTTAKTTTDIDGLTTYCHPSGVLIEQTKKATNTEGVYYTVSTFIRWRMPFLDNLRAINGNRPSNGTMTGVWKISGQTKLIVNE